MKDNVPVSFLFIIDQSFFALLAGCDFVWISPKMSSLSSGFGVFFTGRFERKSSSSSSAKLAAVFGVVDD